MIGLDTTAIVDLFNGDPKVKIPLEKNKPIALTIISLFELYMGLDLENPKHKKEEEYYLDFFHRSYNLPLTKSSCKKASEIFWELRKQGKIINRLDCAIAAIFLSNGINRILTRNKGHFERIKQLTVINY
jgi:predicted nucleic acid-binding protein